jgi:hypothetical protein
MKLRPRSILKLTSVLFAPLFFFRAARAEEKIPNAEMMLQALERGKAVRTQRGLVPQALMKTAVILKAGSVRCGHALVKIEDAKGEGGATYKLTERLKACMPQGIDVEIVDYAGTVLLDSDLALLSGMQTTERSVSSGKDSEKEMIAAQLVVKGDALSWTRKEKRADDPELTTQSEPVKLYGMRPLPRNALIAIAAFAANEPGFKPGISSPLCVPTLDLGWTIETFMIQPAWVTFDLPNEAKDPDVKMLMRVRYLEGELTDKGLVVLPPTREAWEDVLTWKFDSRLRVAGQPEAGETAVTVESVDPDKLDLNAPLDYEKIKEAVKALEEKAQKDSERITKVPLK